MCVSSMKRARRRFNSSSSLAVQSVRLNLFFQRAFSSSDDHDLLFQSILMELTEAGNPILISNFQFDRTYCSSCLSSPASHKSCIAQIDDKEVRYVCGSWFLCSCRDVRRQILQIQPSVNGASSISSVLKETV